MESAERGRARYGREVKTLAHARGEFARERSPWMIVAAIVVVAVCRATLGPPTWQDAVAVAASLISDRVLGTNPEHSAVRRSKTARTLDPWASV